MEEWIRAQVPGGPASKESASVTAAYGRWPWTGLDLKSGVSSQPGYSFSQTVHLTGGVKVGYISSGQLQDVIASVLVGSSGALLAPSSRQRSNGRNCPPQEVPKNTILVTEEDLFPEDVRNYPNGAESIMVVMR